MKDVIYSINGPVVTVKDTSTFGMAEMVYVGNAGLIGEVISVSEARTTIQVYENTTGLLVGEPVKGSGAPLSADAIERLKSLALADAAAAVAMAR